MGTPVQTFDLENSQPICTPWIMDDPELTLKQILKRKGPEIKTVSPLTCVSDVLELLEFDDTGVVIVSRDGKSVDGIISQRDIVRGLRYYGPEVLNVEVACLMAIGVVTCDSGESVAGVLSIMRSHQVQYLPILDQEEIAGLVSLRDIAAPTRYQT